MSVESQPAETAAETFEADESAAERDSAKETQNSSG